MKTNHTKLMFTLVGALSLSASFAEASTSGATPTYKHIKSDVECNSDDVSLGHQSTLQDCADACAADSECEYFVFGKGSKYGRCYHEKTSSAACPEDWETDEYDFYQLSNVAAAPVAESGAPVAQFYIPQSHCTDEVGVRNASAPDIGTLSACDIEVSTEQDTWTATLPGTTMIERIKFSNASHLKDAVVTIEDPDLLEGKRVVFISEPLNPTGADNFELVDPTYDPDVSEYNWLVFGGVIRIKTTGAGVQDAEISIIQGDATQLQFNASEAEAALVQDIADTTESATKSEYQANLAIPVEVKEEPFTISRSISAGNTWMGANGIPLATYSFPPSKTLLPGAEGMSEPKKSVQDRKVSIQAQIKGKTCGLEWSYRTGGNSAVGAQEHVAKFDCDNPNGDPMFLESATDKMYSLNKGKRCYLEWAGEKNSVHGKVWAQERIAKFDCGGGGDTFQIHGNRGADQFVTAKSSTETCHFQWVPDSGGPNVNNNEHIAKWDCEAGASGDPMRIIELSPGGSALPNGVEIELYAGDTMILPFTLRKGAELWDSGQNWTESYGDRGLVGVDRTEADGLQLGLDHDQVLWKLFHSDEVLKAGTTVYLQGVSGWNYGYHGYQEWAPHGLTDIKQLFSTAGDDGSYLGNTSAHGQIYWPEPWQFERFKREAGWIIHPVPNTTSVDKAGKGTMQFTLQSAADANVYLTLGSMEQVTANGGRLNGAYGTVVPKFSVSDYPMQATGAAGATVFTMQWENGRRVNANVDQGLNNFNNEAVTLQTSVLTIKSNISKARITIERMKEMKDLIESTNENIKGARKLTTAVKRIPMIRYVAFPFDKGLKVLEGPFKTMDNKLPAKDRLEQLNTLMTSLDAYLTTSNEVLSVLGSEGEKLNVKRTNAFLQDIGEDRKLPDVHTLNACGTAMSIMPGEVYQGLAEALAELNGTIDNAGTFEKRPANCDEACTARVTMKNAAATVVLLANNLDNINSALVKARSFVKTINSFVSHIRAAGDKVNSGGWMTKTVKFIEDIPVIGWFVKTVRRAVEKYVIDPVMDEAMGLAYGLIQPIVEKKSLSPKTSINDFVNIYDQAMEVKKDFDAAKEKVNPKAKTREKMEAMGTSAAVTAWEDAKGHVYSKAVKAIRTECGLE